MKDPLLRSTNALRALFHQAVVISEADTDRAFYEEINHRLVQNGTGISDCLFLNAQNWQTIPRIVTPLRKLGIPAAAIFDFDVLLQDLNQIWPLLDTNPDVPTALQNKRNKFLSYLIALGAPLLKQKGLKAVDPDMQPAVQEFLNEMAKFGIFIVPIGELEQWLPNLRPERVHKSNWLSFMFDQLGSDTNSKNYIHPGQGDVWDFIEQINTWINNAERLGIPM